MFGYGTPGSFPLGSQPFTRALASPEIEVVAADAIGSAPPGSHAIIDPVVSAALGKIYADARAGDEAFGQFRSTAVVTIEQPIPTTGFHVENYLDLVTRFHRTRPAYIAMLSALLQPFVDLETALLAMPEAFDIDVAIGAQLDAIGEWVGRSRNIEVPVPNAWFSFDSATKGFDYGVWKAPYDSDTGITRLDDETYRIFLKAKIAANHWDGTVTGAAEAFALIFSQSPGSLLLVSDNGDMSMTVGLAGKVPSLLFLALLEQNFLPLKPEGVRVEYLATSKDETPLFGFDIENDYIAGFDVGAWGVPPEYYTSG